MPHPSILIGYGPYGKRVLRSFLAGAAARGALEWDEQGSVGSLNERKLHSLALFWAPDTFGPVSQARIADLLDDSSYELMDDLYSQIEELEGSFEEMRDQLSSSVDREKKRLLDTRRHYDATVPGLDVYVLAQPGGEEAIGALRDLTEPFMKRLADDPAFAAVHEETLLHFIQILDFEDFWAPQTVPVRLALHQVLVEYPDAMAAGRPTVGRVYLFDGSNAMGRRTPESRQQEVVLFLELLLLEGIRGVPDARPLFQRQYAGMPPICTVGVRVVERSSGLLRRLAAASFSRSWLEHIGSGDVVDGASPFADLMAPFRGDRLAATIGEPELRVATARETGSIEEALLAVSPEQPDWGDRLRAEASRLTEAAIQNLSRRSGTRSSQLAQGLLNDFRDELEKTITFAVQQRYPPLTLGSAIDELRRMEEEMALAAAAAGSVPEPPVPSSAPFDEAGRMQREFGMFSTRQLQPARMAVRWWPRLAILFAAALSPLALRAVTEAWVDPPVPPWVQAPVIAAALGGCFWLFGRRALQPLLDRSTSRGRAFYTDAERGRLSERVRQAAASPSVAGRIESYADLLIYGLRQYTLGALAAEIRRARETLEKRRDEAQWLRRQVGEFLLSYQVDDTSYATPTFREGRAIPDVRYSLERSEDLEAVALSLPPGPDRYRELVASKRLFSTWPKPFCDTFLHPLPFLDQLSESFHDRLELDEGETRRRAKQIADFIEKKARVPVSFLWKRADKLPQEERGCLFPSAWRTLPGVSLAVQTAGFTKHQIETPNTERLYLFQWVLGVPAELLLRGEF